MYVHTHTHTHTRQEFLDGEKRNNQEKEKSLGVMEREAAKTRLTCQEAEAARLAFGNEVTHTLWQWRRELTHTARIFIYTCAYSWGHHMIDEASKVPTY